MKNIVFYSAHKKKLINGFFLETQKKSTYLHLFHTLMAKVPLFFLRVKQTTQKIVCF